jgi:hypothetical protein
VSGVFDLTRVNELDYSSTKTDQNESGSSDLHQWEDRGNQGCFARSLGGR